MSKDEAYFQFPLYCLGFGKDPVERLRHIVDLCVVEVGDRRAATMTTREVKDIVTEMPEKDRPSGCRMTRINSLVPVVGMSVLKVRQGNVDVMFQKHDAIKHFCRDMAAQHGPSPLVRVRSDLVWDMIGGRMPYRSFSTLCAVYCMIGRNPWPVRITRDRIIAAAMGYKSPRMMKAEMLAKRQDGAVPMTVNQVRYTLDKLECAGLFVRVQLSPRRTYFSNRMTREQMTEKLFRSATKRKVKLAGNRSADKKLQARIRDTIIVVKPGHDLTGVNHLATTESPPSHHEVTTIIESSLTESSLTETNLREAGVITPAARLASSTANAALERARTR